MKSEDRARLIKHLLEDLAPDGLEALQPKPPEPEGLEGLGGPERHDGLEGGPPGARPEDYAFATRGLEKLEQGREDAVDPAELDGLEAIILPGLRPVAFVRKGRFDDLAPPWSHLNKDALKKKLQPLMRSIGRIDLPDSALAYGGTGFVVGRGLVMTNRHVARLFVDGIGERNLRFTPGSASVDFLREIDTPEDDVSAMLDVRDVLMIHPYWDMALLKVDGLPDDRPRLNLDVRPPDEIDQLEVATVGYPARDPRNNPEIQDRIFERKYNVKRLQPGRVRRRRRVRSFGNQVLALTHDSSTLGGNSGSAVIDLETGHVVALHFAGRYLETNYAVPTYELARDVRVVRAGLEFTGEVAPSSDWQHAWTGADFGEVPTTSGAGSASSAPPPQRPLQAPSQPHAITWTIPLHVTVTVGSPQAGPSLTAADARVTGPPSDPDLAADVSDSIERPMQVPVIYGGLSQRSGYRPGFLNLANDEDLPMPRLTATGREVAAPLADGSFELKYAKFSVVMHARRRLALFTAANVSWQPQRRLVNGRKPTRRELTEVPEDYAEQWVTDPRIADEHQLPDAFYTFDRAAFDKGHLVRRDDVVWGNSFAEMQKANGDTYHVTNCSPQTLQFNRSTRGRDNWGDLENLVQKQTKAERCVAFAGPVLATDDPVFEGIDDGGSTRAQIPQRFWKIIVVRGEDKTAKAYGFVLEQNLEDVAMEEFVVPERWTFAARPVSEIVELLGGCVDLTHLEPFDQYSA